MYTYLLMQNDPKAVDDDGTATATVTTNVSPSEHDNMDSRLTDPVGLDTMDGAQV